MNMYKSIKSCVMDSGIRSDLFASHVGVRQGENLSPLLFALFLNVLDTFFTKQKWDTLDYIDKLYSDCNNNVSSRARNSWYFGGKCYHIFSIATRILIW